MLPKAPSVNHPNASWNESERTRYTYDEYKRLLTVTNPMNETTTNSYALDWVNPLLHTTNNVKYTLSPMGKNVVYDTTRTGQHDVVLRCWNSDRLRAEGQRQYDWRFEASVLNGGLVPYKGLDTDAPMDGYVAQDVVEMPSSLPPEQWRRFVERSYFIRFDDQTFARAKLEMRAGGDHFVVWESVFNPKPGSRNLEEPSSASPR